MGIHRKSRHVFPPRKNAPSPFRTGRFKRSRSQKSRSDLGIFSPVLYQLSYLSNAALTAPSRRLETRFDTQWVETQGGVAQAAEVRQQDSGNCRKLQGTIVRETTKGMGRASPAKAAFCRLRPSDSLSSLTGTLRAAKCNTARPPGSLIHDGFGAEHPTRPAYRSSFICTTRRRGATRHAPRKQNRFAYDHRWLNGRPSRVAE